MLIIETSVIDHIWGNCTEHISNITTTYHTISPDHKTLTATFQSAEVRPGPSKIRTRDWRLLTKAALSAAIEDSTVLQDVFQLEHSEEVAEAIQSELSIIINTLAPATVKQVKKGRRFISIEGRKVMKEADELLTVAISTNHPLDWMRFKHMRNKALAKVEADQKEYIAARMSKSGQFWKTSKELTMAQPQVTPKAIQHNGSIVRKPLELANLANCHFYEKIRKIRSNVAVEKMDPMSILRLVMPPGQTELSIPLITLAQTKHLIRTIKTSG